MPDNVAITPGAGATIAADEVADATLGTVSVQYVKIMDGTLDGTGKAKVATGGGLTVADDYIGGQALAQQSGANAVLTFTFASAVQMVVVESSGADLVSRADPFGGTPSASLGVPCRDQTPTYLPVTTTSVAVYAPTGTTVNVWGFRR